jgi:Kef-type K+ transport system membrane component KefB
MLAGAAGDETLEDRLASIGSGFFVPLFFVVSGVTFNLPLLISSPSSIFQFFIFCLVFICIRLVPLCLYQRHLSQRDVLAQGLLSSTTLPLVVAITYLGAQSGQMRQETATALVGAAIMTVTAFPTLAFWLRSQTNESPVILFILKHTKRILDLFDPALSKLMRFID